MEPGKGTEVVLDTANEILGIGKLIEEGEDFSGKQIILKNGVYDFSKVSQANDGVASFLGSATDRKDSATYKAFKGEFDGNHSTFRNVNLSYPVDETGTITEAQEDGTPVGFFGAVVGTDAVPAKISNLTFENCTLVSNTNTAGFAVGYAEKAKISHIKVINSTIMGPQGVGAVVGRLYDGGSITDCVVENTAVLATDTTIDYAEANESGNHTGNYNAGGIVGCASKNDPPHGTTIGITISRNTVDLSAGGQIFASAKNAAGICGNAGSNVTFSDNHVILSDASQIDGGEGAEAPICAGGAGQYGSTANTITIGSQQAVEITNKATDTFAP